MSGITVKCIYCGTKKTLSLDEAAKLAGPPMCEADGGVMVAVSGSVSSRRKKIDLRKVAAKLSG